MVGPYEQPGLMLIRLSVALLFALAHQCRVDHHVAAPFQVKIAYFSERLRLR